MLSLSLLVQVLMLWYWLPDSSIENSLWLVVALDMLKLIHFFLLQYLPVPEVPRGVGTGATGRLCARVQVWVPVALLALHTQCLWLLQIPGAGKCVCVCVRVNVCKTECIHEILTRKMAAQLYIIAYWLHFSLALSLRRSQCSLCVWRLRLTSSASSLSLSNGCSSLPAPTSGSSTCGTQVS